MQYALFTAYSNASKRPLRESVYTSQKIKSPNNAITIKRPRSITSITIIRYTLILLLPYAINPPPVNSITIRQLSYENVDCNY